MKLIIMYYFINFIKISRAMYIILRILKLLHERPFCCYYHLKFIPINLSSHQEHVSMYFHHHELCLINQKFRLKYHFRPSGVLLNISSGSLLLVITEDVIHSRWGARAVRQCLK
jgi:hypothetical protein